MLTTREQLDALVEEYTTLMDKFNIINSLIETSSGIEYDNQVLALQSFTFKVIQLVRTKYDHAGDILRMWIKFNEHMESNPHVKEQWEVLMTTLQLIE